jgi:histidyl-tRNA synthetase
VVQNRNEIYFPFKRYQIQPVWRADKPQKGRYREFFQCDVDVIGSHSLLNEVELLQIINDIFRKLKIKTVIKINNRKVLYGIAEYIGETKKFMRLTVAIDKLDKVGIEKVIEELRISEIHESSLSKIREILEFKGEVSDKIDFLRNVLKDTETGQKGIAEIAEVFGIVGDLHLDSRVELDLTLARGLNYYTGAIFEVIAEDVKIGSICGGGRYDDLTGIFGLPDVSGVGVSFGADRIYDVMTELGLFPDSSASITKVLFVSFGEKEQKYCLRLVNELRKSGINSEIFPDLAKLKKQMGYANSKQIPYVVLVGETEMENNIITVKDMHSGEQNQMTFEEFLMKF